MEKLIQIRILAKKLKSINPVGFLFLTAKRNQPMYNLNIRTENLACVLKHFKYDLRLGLKGIEYYNICKAPYESMIHNHFFCFKFLCEIFSKDYPVQSYLIPYRGLIKFLKYAHKNGCPWDRSTFRIMVQYGHLDCLKYAHENGCPRDEGACFYAAENGNLDCLKYTHEIGCPWNEDVCRVAAQNGRLKCLKYAHENGCPWDKNTYLFAKREEQHRCLRYALINGCPQE